MRHYLILALLLIAAIGCYIVGSIAGSIVLVGLGVVLEMSFWVGVIKRHRRTMHPV